MDYFESNKDGEVVRVWKGERPKSVDRARVQQARPGAVKPGMRHVSHQIVNRPHTVTPAMVDQEHRRRIADIYPDYLQDHVRATGGRDLKRMNGWLEAMEECALTLKSGRPIPDDFELDYWWRLTDPKRRAALAERKQDPIEAPKDVIAEAHVSIQRKIEEAGKMTDVSDIRKAIAGIQEHVEILNLFTRAQYAASENVSGYRWENPHRDFHYDPGDGPRLMDANDFLEVGYLKLSEMRG
jgi:hypothetical protein